MSQQTPIEKFLPFILAALFSSFFRLNNSQRFRLRYLR